MKKYLGLFLAFMCFAMISGSFATPTDKFDHKIKISLESNPSTGYMWIPEYNHSEAKLINVQFIPNKPKLDGSGGTQIFTFTGKKGAKIHMKYIKSGEKIAIKEKTYTIK